MNQAKDKWDHLPWDIVDRSTDRSIKVYSSPLYGNLQCIPIRLISLIVITQNKNKLTWSALNCSFSSSTVLVLVLVPLAIVPLIPRLLLPPAVLVAPLLLVPLNPACGNPSGFADGPLHEANKLNKCRFKSFDNSVARLSTDGWQYMYMNTKSSPEKRCQQKWDERNKRKGKQEREREQNLSNE